MAWEQVLIAQPAHHVPWCPLVVVNMCSWAARGRAHISTSLCSCSRLCGRFSWWIRDVQVTDAFGTQLGRWCPLLRRVDLSFTIAARNPRHRRGSFRSLRSLRDALSFGPSSLPESTLRT
jgi:hypothetical protein